MDACMQLAIVHRLAVSLVATLVLATGVPSAAASDELYAALPSASQDLSKSDLKFGSKQMKRMLRDRPQMRALVETDDALWQWTAGQFAGKYSGRRYRWMKKTTHEGHEKSVAWHDYSMQKKCGWISVDKSRGDGLVAAPEQMWAGVIYELLNTRNDAAFQQALSDALNHKISKQEYIDRCTKLEYNAVKALTHFYEATWKARLGKTGYQSCSAYWFPDVPSTYESWIEKLSKANPAYFDYYDKNYDCAIENSKVK
jgi:hypothetical protein